jgi:hypothetical protein
MSTLGHDLQAVHRAAHDLSRAVAALHHDAASHVDVLRLVEDTRRIHEDLALLGVHAPPREEEPIVIPDEDYPPEFFADAHDEGIGRA